MRTHHGRHLLRHKRWVKEYDEFITGVLGAASAGRKNKTIEEALEDKMAKDIFISTRDGYEYMDDTNG